jgi:hypothetical protein
MFGRRKKNRSTSESTDERGQDLVLRQGSPRRVEEEPSFDIGDYIIIGIAFLLLVSLVFLFYSVIPTIGWLIYQRATEYLWKPMSWMPLWVGIVIFIILFLTVDHVKPIVYFKNEAKWYRSKYEKNGLIHFRLVRPWKAELIVDSKKVAGKHAKKFVVNANLDVIYNRKNIHVEGTDVFEVTRFTDMEKRLAMKDEQIAVLQRQLESLTGRSFYMEKEMAKIRTSGTGDRRND